MGNDYASFLQQTPWEKVWRLWLPRLIPAAIGLILIAAAILKSMDMELFIRQIKSYGIISHYDLIVISAWALIVIELALGAALLLFYRPSASIMVAALLIGIFALVNGWAWFNGGVEDCGCFGAWVKRTPAEGMIEDLVLLAALCMAWVIRPTIHRPIDFNPSGYKKWIILTSCILGLLLPVVFGFSPLKFNKTKTNS
ncbi:MauE/DoxX family redox-associated membrane protein, partial [Thermodesulfobacteriota bacterium]